MRGLFAQQLKPELPYSYFSILKCCYRSIFSQKIYPGFRTQPKNISRGEKFFFFFFRTIVCFYNCCFYWNNGREIFGVFPHNRNFYVGPLWPYKSKVFQTLHDLHYWSLHFHTTNQVLFSDQDGHSSAGNVKVIFDKFLSSWVRMIKDCYIYGHNSPKATLPNCARLMSSSLRCVASVCFDGYWDGYCMVANSKPCTVRKRFCLRKFWYILIAVVPTIVYLSSPLSCLCDQKQP